MKRYLRVLVLLVSLNTIIQAQNPTYQQKLYYTCKVWGFVKYFHSGVSTCQVNWDSVLIARLPSIQNAVTNSDFNNALDTLLIAAGPMAIVPGILPDTIAPALKRNRSFGWINDPVFRSDVKIILDTIKNNFRPHGECWVNNNSYTGSNYSLLVFPHDSLMINDSLYLHYPNEAHRLLLLFKHWNIVNYFNPYNYVLSVSWDTTLYRNAIGIDSASTLDSFYRVFKKINGGLNDAHVEGLTSEWGEDFPASAFCAALVLRYIQGQYVVVKSGYPLVSVGDIFISVNGRTATYLEDSLRPYISAGNQAVFHRFMSRFLLAGSDEYPSFTFQDSVGAMHTHTLVRDASSYTNYFQNSYFPNDTLGLNAYYSLGCNIGYVNMGRLYPSEVNAMYTALHNKSAIIFDLRDYPNSTSLDIANLIYSGTRCFAKFMIPDTSYPGTFFWLNDSTGVTGNPDPYLGKVIILLNEETQSQAEFSCMVLQAMPNAIKVGNQTAGADGDVSYYDLSRDLQTGYSGLGVFYPNGDSTQRIGIKPDSVVYPTIIGIRHHRDEVLEKALQIANCPLSTLDIQLTKPSINVYPNPTNNLINISITGLNPGDITISVIDIMGKELQKINSALTSENFSSMLDLSNYADGIYLIQIRSKNSVFSNKVVLQKKY